MFLDMNTELELSRSLASISGKQSIISSMASSSSKILGVSGRETGNASGSRPVILETDRRFEGEDNVDGEREASGKILGSCLYK
jgi:hypothetical protein